MREDGHIRTGFPLLNVHSIYFTSVTESGFSNWRIPIKVTETDLAPVYHHFCFCRNDGDGVIKLGGDDISAVVNANVLGAWEVNLSLANCFDVFQIQFPAMRALSISSADAFILVFDVTIASTFEDVRVLRDQIHETKGTTAVPIVVVGNKTDLVEEDSDLREVRQQVAVTLC